MIPLHPGRRSGPLFFRTIRDLLLILVLVSVLPAFAIIVYSQIQHSSREIVEARTATLRTVKDVSVRHDQVIQGTRQFLMTLSKIPDVQSLKPDAANAILAELLEQNPLYANIFVLDAEGRGVAAAIASPRPIRSERKYFRDVKRTRDFSAGEYASSASTGSHAIHFAYPILARDGRFKGMIGVTLDLAGYARIFPVANLPQGSTLTLTDHRGTVIYQYPEQEQQVGGSEVPGIVSRMSEDAHEGVFRFTGPRGTKRLNAYKHFRLTPKDSPYLTVRIGVPEEQVWARSRQALAVNLTLLGIAFVVVMISAWLLGNVTIVRRVKRLVEASGRLKSGDMSARAGLDHKGDEIGQLGKAFDEMAETLQIRQAQRDEAEDSLRESENKFKDLVEKSLVGVYLIQDDVFKYINPRLAEIHGYEVEDLLEKEGPAVLVHPDNWATVKGNIDKRLSGEVPSIGYTFKAITKNREIIFVEAYGSRTTYQGRPAVIGSLVDITRRKAAEEALVRERQRFQLLAENAPFGMAVVDGRSFTYVNPKFTEMLGYTIDELREPGQWFHLAYPDKDYRRGIIRGWLADSRDAKPGERTPRTYTTHTKDGRPREISFIAVRINESETLITCTDMTEQKLLEAQLLQSQKMEAVGTLAGGIAHDFNNLLMTILGYTSLMRMNSNPHDPQNERFKIIEEQVKSGTDLTRQLLGFARGGKYEIRPTGLNQLVTKSAEMFGRTRRELTIRIKQHSDLWVVETDRGQIEQVLLNLLVNAWQAMPGGGYIYIETDNVVLTAKQAGLHDLKPGRYVKVSMADTGTGMDAATQKRIFEPFFTTKEMGLGSGLGLASAYGIVKNHNGTITVDSAEGKGSVFDIYLPATDKEEAAEEQTAPAEELLRGSETILVVDDQEEVAAVAREMLEALGYAVVIAKNGEDAISTYTREKDAIDLVMVDMIMPEMSGRQAYGELKKIDPTVKVILASGYSLEGQAAEILDEGCAGFIQKPFNIGAVSRKIRAILDSR